MNWVKYTALTSSVFFFRERFWMLFTEKITSRHSASLSKLWWHKSALCLDRAPLKINTKHLNIKAVERKGHLFFFHMFRTLSIFEVLYESCSSPSPISETIKATVTKIVAVRAIPHKSNYTKRARQAQKIPASALRTLAS